ncbi:DCN1-like protein 1 [Camellia lanceoleosa]|uniref:DCN1-like protein 1 n=1 Tax=Camellia lanceoleosa TaxID=1840588 RepID=A0ACC0HLD6_9ERIC|nr:DCN1-like protein 1 [Camellia lanceoleosa]
MLLLSCSCSHSQSIDLSLSPLLYLKQSDEDRDMGRNSPVLIFFTHIPDNLDVANSLKRLASWSSWTIISLVDLLLCAIEDMHSRPIPYIFSLIFMQQLVLSWHMKAATMCEFSKQEFIGGLQALGIDSLEKFRDRMQFMRSELKDEQKFREIYNFAFGWAKEKVPGQRYCPPVEVFKSCCREVKKGNQLVGGDPNSFAVLFLDGVRKTFRYSNRLLMLSLT